MTTKELQLSVQKYCVLNGHTIVCPNVNYFFWFECDVLSLFRGYAFEFELKISRSDFLADKKKKEKHAMYSCPNGFQKTRIPNYFIYTVPKGMVLESEIPEYAGLVYADGENIEWVKHPPRLHNVKPDKDKLRDKVLQLYQQRDALGCTLLTHNNRENKKRNEQFQAEMKERYNDFNH